MDHETLISKAIANGDDGENLLDSLLYEADGRVELTSYLDFCLDMMQQDEPDRSPRLMLQEVLGNDFGVWANDIPIGEFNTEMMQFRKNIESKNNNGWFSRRKWWETQTTDSKSLFWSAPHIQQKPRSDL